MRRINGGALVGLLGTCICVTSFASGPLLIDHRVNYDNSGIWKSSYQDALVGGVMLATVGGALWQGGDDRLGRTLWQSVDSMAFSIATTEAAKVAFSRQPPLQTNDPDSFFNGRGNDSFPSLHVAAMTAAVTPVMLEYGHDHPAVYGLGALVAYEMVGRVKVQEHWQSDVLAGWLIGTGFSVYAHSHDQPLLLSVMPHSVSIGFRKAL